MSRIACIVFFALLIVPCISDAETIDVQIKGVDDGAKTTKQRDYKEAVLFAKREAIERAGVKIKSMTTVKDMVVNSDYIESKAEAVLMPGYNIIDIGYTTDGTYQVVLVGKVKTVSEGIDSKELRYAKSLMDRGEKDKAKKIITDIIENSKDDNAVAEAMYYLILWNFASDEKDSYDRLKAYYPNSKYVSRVESVLAERERKRNERIEAERKKQEDELISLGVKKEDIDRVKTYDGRFVLYTDGIVWDSITDLEWIIGPYVDGTWAWARAWAEDLTVAGGDWRMPTMKELKTLYQKGAGTCNMTRLLKTTGRYVWSGETEGSSEAWIFTYDGDTSLLGDTSVLDGYSVRSFSHATHGFAVRSRR